MLPLDNLTTELFPSTEDIISFNKSTLTPSGYAGSTDSSTQMPLTALSNGSFRLSESMNRWDCGLSESMDCRNNQTIVRTLILMDLGLYEAVVGSLSLIVIIAANSFVIYLIAKSWQKKQYHNIPNLLVMSLAVTDFLVGLLGYPFSIISGVAGSWLGGVATCAFSHFTKVCFQTFSQCIVVLMAIERFLSIRCPFFYEKHLTVRIILTLISVLFLYSTIIGSFVVLAQDFAQMKLFIPSYNLHCFAEHFRNETLKKVYIVWNLVQGFVLIVVLLFCNICVICTLKTMEKKVQLACPKSREEYLRQLDMICGMHREFSRLMITINVVFIVFMMPFQVRNLFRVLSITLCMFTLR